MGDITPETKDSQELMKDVLFLTMVLSLALSILLGGTAEAGPSDSRVDECMEIDDDTKRLQCYDEIAGQRQVVKEVPSYLSRLWELDEESQRKMYHITPYRSSYFLPVTYNRSPNIEPVQEDDPDTDVQNYEAAFQISFKIKLWQDVLVKDIDLWFGYTQRSFWQVYNVDDSSPFRETNYEPEVLFNFHMDYNLLGLKARYVNIGYNHQSNGRSEPLSRSWNRLVANFGFERDNFTFILNTWYRIPEDKEDDDNPNIEDYLGYGQINLSYLWNDHKFGFFLRNNLHVNDNKGALQLEYCFPLSKRVSLYIQYFNGYGESLLDYNASSNRIGIGLILKDWYTTEQVPDASERK